MTERKSGGLPPATAGRLAAEYPTVWSAYEALGRAAAGAGPLDERTRRLVKIALAAGARSEGAVHSHVRQALDEGATVDELRQVALLAITTLGFPAAMAVLTWIDDVAGYAGDEKG